MRQSAIMVAFRQFLKTTTLHGFKYLSSPHSLDRVGWLACCCVSACCAGVLCAVLWARFQQVPALLILRDLREGAGATIQTMPDVAVCPPANAIATLVITAITGKTSNVSTDKEHTILTRILNRKPTYLKHLRYLEDFFNNHNKILSDVLFQEFPSCAEIVKYCRFEREMVPCSYLFKFEMTKSGVCCVMKPKRLSPTSLKWDPDIQIMKEMDLIIECGFHSSSSCSMFTQYIGQEYVEMDQLLRGQQYYTQVTFTAEEDFIFENQPHKCNDQAEYSSMDCMIECTEKLCGCSDPLLNIDYHGEGRLKRCSLTQLICLRNTTSANQNCKCLPRCKKVTDTSSIQSSRMVESSFTIDPLLMGINRTDSTALFIRVRNGESRFYNSIATETWITLLASLGGVFNMFLGVGLFSALEVLYLIFIRVPITISTPSELYTPASH